MIRKTSFNQYCSMKNHYKFERVPYLRLLDLKAQKKNISCKQFMDIPLTFQEQIAQQIANQRPPPLTQSNQRFHIRKHHPKISVKKVKALAQPKKWEQGLPRSESAHNLSGLISSCDRLKSQLLTNKRLSRFQKDASKCYQYLFELSNFNFQKYERD